MFDLNEVKEYLRIDYSDEDEFILSLIETACKFCADYLRLDYLPDPAPSPVKQAVLFVVGFLFENRSGDKIGIPQAVYVLLDPYRKAAF